MNLEERVAKLEKLIGSLLARSETLRILFLIALADAVKNDPNRQARYTLIRAEARRVLSGEKRGDRSLETVIYLMEEIPEQLEELLSDWDYVQKNLQKR
ncbi:MAG: hypothetical protein IIA72_18685 [Proteobacteria bacterium]|nr:hypothetical protein [Pseudomonadota bacterium]